MSTHNPALDPSLSFADVAASERSALQSPTTGESAKIAPTIGLALSGGGIRSATFSLGVLQALAKGKLLKQFDYLSTVSGGGYIGSWLSAWISRTNLDTVEEQLGRTGSSTEDSPRNTEPRALAWLRRYSNYLTPRVGLLSTDSLTLMEIVIRNVFLNMIVVLAFLVTCLLLPRLAWPMAQEILECHSQALMWVAGGFGLLLLPLCIAYNLLYMSNASDGDRHWLMTSSGVAATVIAPGVAAAVAAALAIFGGPPPKDTDWHLIIDAAPFVGVAFVLWLALAVFKRPRPSSADPQKLPSVLNDGIVFIVAGAIALSLAIALLKVERTWYSEHAAASVIDYTKLLTFGPPAMLITFGLAGFVFVGLVGTTYYEHSREWWSRLNAWFFVISAAWFLVMATSFYVPAIVDWILASAHGWVAKIIGAGWIGSLLASVLGPRLKVVSDVARNHLMAALNVAAYVVIIGFVMSVATLTERALAHYVDNPNQASTCEATLETTMGVGLNDHVTCEMYELDAWSKTTSFQGTRFQMPASLATTSCALLTLLFFGWRIDVNKFSLHNMYKNRLIRCYLGATNPNRKEQPFTGFDEGDDLSLASLAKAGQRPFHIINTTLNIAQGKNLAWQERKAASFIFTPKACGFCLGGTQGDTTDRPSPHTSTSAGYRPTELYGGTDEGRRPGFTLGMAMAVSGAAASPNMGSASSPALAFVMTLFNARLGRWSANPMQKKWKRSTPKFGLYLFLQELFGMSNEDRNFVYLSDGGHFENLGLYELVHRRCSTIWVVDAAADPDRIFADLGRAIRQCRVDFGVEIKLDLRDLVTKATEGFPKAGFAFGTIDYGAPHTPGRLVYIKPTMCTDRAEPDDVLAYAAREDDFPQQTTADQFFDESQFESYRRLGQHIAEMCIAATVSPVFTHPAIHHPAKSAA